MLRHSVPLLSLEQEEEKSLCESLYNQGGLDHLPHCFLLGRSLQRRSQLPGDKGPSLSDTGVLQTLEQVQTPLSAYVRHTVLHL